MQLQNLIRILGRRVYLQSIRTHDVAQNAMEPLDKFIRHLPLFRLLCVSQDNVEAIRSLLIKEITKLPESLKLNIRINIQLFY